MRPLNQSAAVKKSKIYPARQG